MSISYKIGFFISRMAFDYQLGRKEGFVPANQKEQIRKQVIDAGNKFGYIEAIKKHRELTGSGLYDAKVYVDAIRTNGEILS